MFTVSDQVLCLLMYILKIIMASEYNTISFTDFKWFNEPSTWRVSNNTLEVTTGLKTDFWQTTWYNFTVNTGHLFGVEIKDDFTFVLCVEAEFTTLYDQAGIMIYIDEKHWLKAGIEYNDGRPMIGSVYTNGVSDWATGVFPGDPRKFWIKLSKVGNIVCVKYSTDKTTWVLLRLSTFPESAETVVGAMCCSPRRAGLRARFSELAVAEPVRDILHSD